MFGRKLEQLDLPREDGHLVNEIRVGSSLIRLVSENKQKGQNLLVEEIKYSLPFFVQLSILFVFI